MNPKVSIIVPVYNVEDYLIECMDSVINQSFRDIEIICIDDGSTDNSLAILESYARNDNRVKIISQENKGLGNARNVGLDNSNGDYILFVDSDDYIFSDTVESLYNNAINNSSDLVIFKFTRNMDDDRNSYLWGFECRPNFSKDVDFNNLNFDYHSVKNHVLNTFTNVWIHFFRREFLRNYDDFYFQENIAYEDVLFHVKSFLRAERISYVPKVFYFYRNRQDSIMNQTENSSDIFTVINSIKDFLIEKNYWDEFKNEFDYFNIHHTLYYMICTNSEEYFQRAKEEFLKINLSSNHIVDEKKLRLYMLVLESSDFNEYLKGFFKIKEEEFKSQRDSLNRENDLLKMKSDSLESENKILKNEIKELEKENNLLKNKNRKLKKRLKEYKSRKIVSFVDGIKSLNFFK